MLIIESKINLTEGGGMEIHSDACLPGVDHSVVIYLSEL